MEKEINDINWEQRKFDVFKSLLMEGGISFEDAFEVASKIIDFYKKMNNYENKHTK